MDTSLGPSLALGSRLGYMTQDETNLAPLDKPDASWREQLNDLEYQVLRHGGTERPFVGEYTNTTTEGVYSCKGCGTELFRSDHKFESTCGWPSFFEPLAGDRVRQLTDTSFPGRPRIEVRCAACDGHLGHVFEGEGYDTPTDLRYCINSVSLSLEPATASEQ